MAEDEFEDEDWSRPVECFESLQSAVHAVRPPNSPKSYTFAEHAEGGPRGTCTPSTSHLVTNNSHIRTIVHIDLDCFYAQVEMVRDPTLRSRPLGIQQKYLLVTCNYVARSRGVTKLMRITDALQRCPELVIVSGEDLTHYREMSYKITELLQQFSPLVERLGFDENFIDVTHLVSQRLRKEDEETEVFGQVYGETAAHPEMATTPPTCTCGCHRRLLIGSHIAREMRESLRTELGLTSCAGVAHNKLLAKLVGSTHKPNDQTTLFPHMATTLMGSLTRVTQVPGIGHSTGKKLSSMGISTLDELIEAPFTLLKEEFGYQTASTMQRLCQGHDESLVVQSGPPQSISDEDSFKKCSSLQQAQLKMKDLLSSLLQRLKKDERQPHTLRLSVRKYSRVHKWTRESRQCGIPDGILHSLDSDEDAARSKLLDLCVALFHKMVDTSRPFHLTLINVCFAKFQSQCRTTSDISKFFSLKSTMKGSDDNTSKDDGSFETDAMDKLEVGSQNITDLPNGRCKAHNVPSASKSEDSSLGALSQGAIPSTSYLKLDDGLSRGGCKHEHPSPSLTISSDRPRNSDIKSQMNLTELGGDKIKLCDDGASPRKSLSFFARKLSTVQASQARDAVDPNFLPTGNAKDHLLATCSAEPAPQEVSLDATGIKASTSAKDKHLASRQIDVTAHAMPPNVDPSVFAELPSELQQELSSEWSNASLNTKQATDCGRAHDESPHREFLDIDHSVFEELPLDIQREVLDQQKQRKRTLSSASPQTKRTLHVKRPRTAKTPTKKSVGKSKDIKDFFTLK